LGIKHLLGSVWDYRYFIISSIKSEFLGRFARSKLGALWAILNPLAQAMIFALVLGQVMGAKLGGGASNAAYPVYLMAGIAAWGLFSEILNRSANIFIEYSGMMKKIVFPKISLPLIVWGSALINHILLLLAIVVVSTVLGHFPGLAWLGLVPGVLLISMFAFSLGLIAGVFNVFARDIGQIIAVVLQLWFWLTPIVYQTDIVPQNLRWILDINPMAQFVRIYQDAILFDRWPDLLSLAIPVVITVALLIGGFALFRRAGPELVDVL